MTFRHRSVARLSFALLLVWPTPKGATPCHAEDSSTSEADEDRAKRLFEEGRTHYDLGEYADAIDLFRNAYRSAPDPLILFAIAQAQRLAGTCRDALVTYRRFLQSSESGPARLEAERHVADLQAFCPAAEPVPAPPPPSATMMPAEPTPRGGISTRDPALAVDAEVRRPAAEARKPPAWPHRIALVSGGAGVVLGVAGAALYAQNTLRFHRWELEDVRLASTPNLVTKDEIFRRQETNDALSRSIQSRDRLSVGLLVTSGVLLVVATIAYFAGRNDDKVTP